MNRPPRNPRRAYDKDGNEIPSAAIAHLKADGMAFDLSIASPDLRGPESG
jgi:hypothetical protein